MSGKGREARVVGGPDPIEPESERIDEEPHVRVEIGGWNPDLGPANEFRARRGGAFGVVASGMVSVWQRLSWCHRMRRAPVSVR